MFAIAIVEDEELERRALRSIIERHVEGASVVGEARSGIEAVRLLDSQPIDLLLLDIRIPRPNGLEVLQMLRERRLQTKVLIITAYDYFEVMQTASELKADGVLLKPVRTEALLKAIYGSMAAAAAGPAMEAKAARHTSRAAAAAAWPEAAEIGEFRARLVELVEQNAYRACLSLVRRQLEALYAHKDAAPRHAVLDIAEILTVLVERDGRRLPAPLAQRVEALETHRLDPRTHYKVQELFSEITDLLFDEADDRGLSASQRIETVRNYIERNLHKGITLEDAADYAHISPCYLSRLFRKEMNVTFIAYLKAQRIERAKDLLRGSDLPILNVSLDLAYQDANYFCKAFKKEVGVSPSEYRRKAQQSRRRQIVEDLVG